MGHERAVTVGGNKPHQVSGVMAVERWRQAQQASPGQWGDGRGAVAAGTTSLTRSVAAGTTSLRNSRGSGSSSRPGEEGGGWGGETAAAGEVGGGGGGRRR